jgi:uncharacterized membrane protein YgcG
MIFIPRRRTSGSSPWLRGKTPGEQFLRFILLICVFALVVWLFWQQSEKTMKQLAARGTVWDQTSELSKGQKDALREFASMFKDDFGLELKLNVVHTDVVLPDLDSKTIFIGLNPETQQVLVEFPPLMRRALGDEFLYSIQNDHFTPYFEKGNWAEGLFQGVNKIWEAMMGVTSPDAGAGS